jgi:hypothetical protein
VSFDNWTTGDSVIHHLNISIFNERDSADQPSGFWIACIEPSAENTFWGATPLVAAMRTAVYAGVRRRGARRLGRILTAQLTRSVTV